MHKPQIGARSKVRKQELKPVVLPAHTPPSKKFGANRAYPYKAKPVVEEVHHIDPPVSPGVIVIETLPEPVFTTLASEPEPTPVFDIDEPKVVSSQVENWKAKREKKKQADSTDEPTTDVVVE